MNSKKIEEEKDPLSSGSNSFSDTNAGLQERDSGEEEFLVNSNYLEKLKISFRFSLKTAGILTTIGIFLVIIGQSFRNLEVIGQLFGILAMVGLILSIVGFLLLIRDVQLSSVAKIKYKIVVDSEGIFVFQEGIGTDQPQNFIPFQAFIEAKVVSVSPFIKKTLFLNLSALKFSQLAKNLQAVLVKLKTDPHLQGRTQKQIFFEIPIGQTLFFVEDTERFLKVIKRKRIKRKT